MTKTVKISEARSKLFDLVEYVNSTNGVVVIQHRDKEEETVLINKSHLDYLEHCRQEFIKGECEKPFTLAGSMQSPLSDDELEQALQEIRDEVREQELRKEREF